MYLKNGERGGARTHGHRIKSPMLYQLSYPSTTVFCKAKYGSALANGNNSVANKKGGMQIYLKGRMKRGAEGGGGGGSFSG